MSFDSNLRTLDMADLSLSINSTRDKDVKRVLGKQTLDINDLACLLSPAALTYLEPMAQRAKQLTRRRFGNTMQLFVPLYLSNLCANECTYCGFSMSNRIKRKTLSVADVEQECLAIKSMGFDSILVVTGEHESKVGMAYFETVVPILKRHFSHVLFEVQPLSTADYATLKSWGVDGIMVYQETYSALQYAKYHLHGKKRDFSWRLAAPERIAEGEMDKIGLGVLLGLSDWRVDSLVLGKHLSYLRKRFWRTRYSVAFPRIRPCEGGVQSEALVTDSQLVQLICAFRLFDPEIEIVLSTREPAELRDNLMALGVTSMSAGSSTQPGGYADTATALSQFDIDDQRHPSDVATAIEQKGLQPIWRDWHHAFSGRPNTR